MRRPGILPGRSVSFAAARPRCCSLRGPHQGEGGSPPHPASARPPLPRRPPRCGFAAPPASLSPGCGIEGIPAAAKASPAACAAEPARRHRAASGAGGCRRPHGILPVSWRRHPAAAAGRWRSPVASRHPAAAKRYSRAVGGLGCAFGSPTRGGRLALRGIRRWDKSASTGRRFEGRGAGRAGR